jgi:hypothetical protein
MLSFVLNPSIRSLYIRTGVELQRISRCQLTPMPTLVENRPNIQDEFEL